MWHLSYPSKSGTRLIEEPSEGCSSQALPPGNPPSNLATTLALLLLSSTVTSTTITAQNQPSQTASVTLPNPALTTPPSDLIHKHKKITAIDAFRPVPEFDRHDPSNIISHDDLYWLFYTRNIGNHAEVSVSVASSPDGYVWIDGEEVLGRGSPGHWDESGALAPYCVNEGGRFYLFYTGFRDGNLATRHLGCATAHHPAGPWHRLNNNPILRQNPNPEAWDSGMLGDSNVLFRNGKWWLYYKSRRDQENSRETHIGVATSDTITGPYSKHPANPLFAGHAFSAWLHQNGVAAICGAISPKIKWSVDGIRFTDAGQFPNHSTGLYTPNPQIDNHHKEGFKWGIEVYAQNGARGLRRFDSDIAQPANHGD